MPRLAPLALLLLALGARGQEPPRPRRAAGQPTPGRPTLFVSADMGLYASEAEGVRPGWAPVWVALENRGPSLQLELQVDVYRGQYLDLGLRRAVDLPAGQSRREWFLVPVVAGSSWEVVGREAGRAEPLLRSGLRPVRFDPGWSQWGYRPALRVLELVDSTAPSSRGGGWLPVMALRTFPRLATPAELPDTPLAWRDVDVVAVREADLGALTAGQLQALRDWVLTGGQLLLAPADRLGWLEHDALRRVAGPLEVDALAGRPTCLEQLYGTSGSRAADALPRTEVRLLRVRAALRPSTWRGEGTDVDGRPRDWPPVEALGELRVPLVQAIPRGRGTVHLLALDPGLRAFQDWCGRAELMDDLCGWLELHAREAGRADLQAEGELAAMVDSRRRPAIWPVLLLLAAYVACVGPLNGWLLRRRGAQPLLVLTVPGLALLFSVVVFGLGALMRGATLTCWRASLLAGQLGDEVLHERTLTSALAGVSGEARLRLDPGAAVLRLPPLRGGTWREPFLVDQRPGAAGAATIGLRAWEPHCLASEGLRPAGRGVTVRESPEGPVVQNDTPWTLVAPAWLQGDDLFQGPERLGPGQEAPLPRRAARPPAQRLELALAGLGGGDPRRRELARRLLDRFAATQARRLLLAGLEPSPAATSLEDRDPDLDLTLLSLVDGRR